MSHELNYRVVAEGVGKQEAYEFLAESGCDEIQGYLISRPLQPSGFGKWLSAKLRSGGEERAACAASRMARQESHSWGGCAMARP